MAMHGNVWSTIFMYGHVWSCMADYGHIWACMGVYGHVSSSSCMMYVKYDLVWSSTVSSSTIAIKVMKG